MSRPVPIRRFGGEFFPTLTPAIKFLLIVNAVVFALNLLLGGSLSGNKQGDHWLALSWPSLWDGYGLGLLRLLSYQFTHDYFDAWHFVTNMVGLYLFGHAVEGALGTRGTLKFYVIAGVIGGAVQMALMVWMGHASVPTVGASGPVYGMIVYAAFLMPHARTFCYLQLWVLAAILVGVALYSQVIELREGFQSGVAHGGHLGGALWGYCAWRWGFNRDYGRDLPGRSFWHSVRRLRARGAQRRVDQDRARMDQLLDKVKQQGLGSLSDSERRFMKGQSERSRR